MAPAKLEAEDHSRDAAFNKAMHKDSSKADGGFRAMVKKDKAAQKAAVDEYFKHWDNKAAKDETDADREVVSAIPNCTPILNANMIPRPEELNTLLSQDSMPPPFRSLQSIVLIDI
jgi:sterol 24-C-methyltransferase